MHKLKKLVERMRILVAPTRTEKGVEGYFRFAQGRTRASRISLCNHLIVTYGLNSYLEIRHARQIGNEQPYSCAACRIG